MHRVQRARSTGQIGRAADRRSGRRISDVPRKGRARKGRGLGHRARRQLYDGGGPDLRIIPGRARTGRRRRWPNFVLKSTIRRSSSSPRRFKSIALRSISDSSLSVLRWGRRPRCRQTFRSGRRRVEFLISLGTLRNDEPEFYRLCFDAFGAENWQAFLSIGKTVDPVVLGARPENFVVRPHLPQTTLLQVVDVFVTHAGLNSVMESLYYNAPMIMVPGTREQKLTAERAEQLGLGFRADFHDLSANALRDLASRAVDDVSIPPAIAEIRKSMRATVGYARAADVIQRVAASGSSWA